MVDAFLVILRLPRLLPGGNDDHCSHPSFEQEWPSSRFEEAAESDPAQHPLIRNIIAGGRRLCRRLDGVELREALFEIAVPPTREGLLIGRVAVLVVELFYNFL